MQNKKSNYFLIFFLTTFLFVATLAINNSKNGSSYLQTVQAEDGEDEKDEEDDEDEKDEEDDGDEDSARDQYTTKTITEPARTVTRTVMKDLVLKDTDRDGLTDDKDPHRDIAEIYIVTDANLNGIDDKYEISQ